MSNMPGVRKVAHQQLWATRISICVTLFISLAAVAGAQSGPLPDGSIISVEPYVFPPFAEAGGIRNYFGSASLYTSEEFARAASDPEWPFQIVKYRSDGLDVTAYLYAPRSSQKKLPVIVYNRGSFVWGDIGHALALELYPLAKAGFVVIAPMYRESAGAAGKDEMGGRDLLDLMNLLPVLHKIESADTQNIFLYGVSRGSMMAWQAARDGFPVRAIATVGGFTDLGMLLESDPPRYAPLITRIWPNFGQEREAILERRSIVKWADRVTVPLLILHGERDPVVPPLHALRLAELRTQHGTPYELVIYAGDDHRASANREDRDARVIRFFRKSTK